MTGLEIVALDQQRWGLTAGRLKTSNHERFSLMVKLTLAGAILQALALQIHTRYPTASEVAGYAAAVALGLVLVMRGRGLRAERVQAWVLAAAAAQSLKSEMYQYRTSAGPYSRQLGRNPEAKLLERRDEILEKVKPIQKYAVEPDPTTVARLGPLDADAYIAERVNTEISRFREFSDNLPKVQSAWLKQEYFLTIGGALLAAALTFTHSQAYGAWVIVITILSLASGVTAKAERYATLLVGYLAMPDRLTRILSRWQATQGPLEELVDQIEAAILSEGQAWVAGVDESIRDTTSDSPSKLVLRSPA